MIMDLDTCCKSVRTLVVIVIPKIYMSPREYGMPHTSVNSLPAMLYSEFGHASGHMMLRAIPNDLAGSCHSCIMLLMGQMLRTQLKVSM